MRALVLLAVLLAVQTSGVSLFPWGDGVEVGFLDPDIDEASGLAVSAVYPNRLYHINDSGDTGRFFVTDPTGANAQSVRISDFNPVDVEDLSIGPCGQSTDCLFLADIGDNNRKRASIEIVVVQEQQNFPAEVRALARLRLRYPDGAYDSEGLAVHPDGTLYLLTKQGLGNKSRPGIPRLYKIPTTWWKRPASSQVLDFVREIDLAKVAPNVPPSARLPTSMNISRDGKRALILFYIDAVELALDFSQPIPDVTQWRDGRDYQRISLMNLPQQEAIAYTPDSTAFFYDTEARESSRAHLMQVKKRF
jgi:hypothetical protein